MVISSGTDKPSASSVWARLIAVASRLPPPTVSHAPSESTTIFAPAVRGACRDQLA